MMMFTKHVSRQLAAYVDGALARRQALQCEIHIEQCAKCRADYEQVKLGMASVEHLPLVEAPAAIWASIEAASRAARSRRAFAARGWLWAMAATAVLAMVIAVSWRLAQRPGTRWEVVRLDGSPAVDAKPIRDGGLIAAGGWIETDSGSRATVKIGEIGFVEIAPNTRVRVVTAQPGEHRLALARGEILAKISAPPRLFFVDTPAGTAVDLGCEYVLNTDEGGVGLLRVAKGWVSFQWKTLESLVPAGASCRTRPDAGPGVPYFDDAPERVIDALDGFVFDNGGSDMLSLILDESRVRDTLTLWHLLSRVDPGDRARVYDRIAALAPVPAGVSRERALQLDPDTLRRWREELAWTW